MMSAPYRKSQRSVIVLGIMVLFIGLTLFALIYFNSTWYTINKLNDHLQSDGVQIGMTERQLIDLWGEGQHQEAFGGHYRQYEQRLATIGISNDKDNDLYGAVGSIEFANPAFSVYTIKVGDDKEEARKKLRKRGYAISHDGSLTMSKGEFTIAMQGSQSIESIRIWFDDKHLKDRNY